MAITVNDAGLRFAWALTRREKAVTGIVLHHSESDNTSVADIHRWHQARGWNGIGYHYYVRKDGSVWQGRPEWAVGAHAGANERKKAYKYANWANIETLGICAEGRYHRRNVMPEAQKKAIVELCRDLIARYPGIRTIYRHSEVSDTDCPGQYYPFEDIVTESFKAQVSALYRVRASRNDARSQIGAYYYLENAEKACPEGYNVYDSDWNVVYTAPVKSDGQWYRTRLLWENEASQIAAHRNLELAKESCPPGYSVFNSEGECVYSAPEASNGDDTGEAVKYGPEMAREALRAAAGLTEALPEYDVNGDGRVTAEDARIILRRAAKLEDE
jgi:N-acetyl-anhydromuramyl-L-alanine amidase AmpD